MTAPEGEAPSSPEAGRAGVLIVASDAISANHLAHLLAETRGGAGESESVAVLHTSGRPLRGLPKGARQIHAPASRVDVAGGERRLLEALTRNPSARKALATAATLVVADGSVDAARRQVKASGVDVRGWSEYSRAVTSRHLAALLDARSGLPSGRPATAALVEEALAMGGGARTPELLDAVGRALATLGLGGGHREVLGLREVLARLDGDERTRLGIPALLRISELSLGGPPDLGDAHVARVAFDEAMSRFEMGDLTGAVRQLTIGMRLVFHSELHADGERSLLIDDPVGQLSPWWDSRFGTYVRRLPGLARPTERAPTGLPPRVVLLCGAYGRFYGPVVDLLTAAGVAPELVTPDDLGPMFGRRDPTEQLLGEWLRCVDPARWEALPEDRGAARRIALLEQRLAGADVVFVDWCDPGAVFASLLVPEAARLVVRVHRVDATKAWSQLVRWDRVAEVILVSEHVRTMFARQLAPPGTKPSTRLTVANNLIDVDRYRRPKSADAHRAIAVVGWGRRVKDPIFALEVLLDLVRDDSTWTLHLIGRDFPDSALVPVQSYLDRFRELAHDPRIRDNIVWVGFTGRLPEALDRCGFALSSSVVEGWPVGVVEAAASGCVPVVRDWPQVHELGGARQIYAGMPEWVIDTPSEAADRIRSYAAKEDWMAESARSRELATTLSAVGATEEAYLDVILGRRAPTG